MPKVPLPLTLPTSMVQEIRDWGIRLDRSASWLIAAAWKLSRDWISGLDRRSADVLADEETEACYARQWFVPAEAVLEIASASERLKIPPEKVVQLAWGFARPGP